MACLSKINQKTMKNELPKNWIIDTQEEKDSPLMPKFIEWFVKNRTENISLRRFCGFYNKRLSAWFGLDEQELITLEQWNAFYFPEWKPKCGEIIFVNDYDGGIWDKSLFVVKYEDMYYCKGGEEQLLYGWKCAKPLSKESTLQPIMDKLKAEAEKLGLKVNITVE